MSNDNNVFRCYESCGSELVIFAVVDGRAGGPANIILSKFTTGASKVSEMKKDNKNDATALPKYKII